LYIDYNDDRYIMITLADRLALATRSGHCYQETSLKSSAKQLDECRLWHIADSKIRTLRMVVAYMDIWTQQPSKA